MFFCRFPIPTLANAAELSLSGLPASFSLVPILSFHPEGYLQELEKIPNRVRIPVRAPYLPTLPRRDPNPCQRVQYHMVQFHPFQA